jgi:hypothetical protein
LYFVTKKVVGVFVRFRAPLPLNNLLSNAISTTGPVRAWWCVASRFTPGRLHVRQRRTGQGLTPLQIGQRQPSRLGQESAK